MCRELSSIAASLSSLTPFLPVFFTRVYLQMHKDDSGNGSGLASLALTIRAMQKFLNHENQVITRRALDLCCCAPSKMWARSASILLVRIVGLDRVAATTSFQSFIFHAQVQNRWFERVVIVMVVLSSVLIAIESPDVTSPLALKSEMLLLLLLLLLLLTQYSFRQRQPLLLRVLRCRGPAQGHRARMAYVHFRLVEPV